LRWHAEGEDFGEFGDSGSPGRQARLPGAVLKVLRHVSWISLLQHTARTRTPILDYHAQKNTTNLGFLDPGVPTQDPWGLLVVMTSSSVILGVATTVSSSCLQLVLNSLVTLFVPATKKVAGVPGRAALDHPSM